MTAPKLRESEIRPDGLKPAQLDRYAADVAWLLERRDRFVHVGCPACDADEPAPAWRKYDLDYAECSACGTVYMSPRPEPDLLSEYYRSSQNYAYWNDVIFPASEDARRAKLFRPRAERVVEVARRNGSAMGTLVDVGAGFGTFCEEVVALDAFERVIAVEPEPNLAATCRAKGLEVVEAGVEAAELPADVDVITSFEVVEHLFSPRAYLKRCAALLPAGGLLVTTCPNVRGFDVVVLHERSLAVDTEHLNYFHPQSLALLLARAGFDVLEQLTPGRLDAELVRKAVLAGEADLSVQPFLRQVLLDEWERVGEPFQDFLAANGLSSHQWALARRVS